MSRRIRTMNLTRHSESFPPLVLGGASCGWRAKDLNRLSQPVFNLALVVEQTASVLEPPRGGGSFSRKLIMPLGDFGITSRAKRGIFPQPSQPIIAKGRVFYAPALVALKKRHDWYPHAPATLAAAL
jgi:hypothetical protein